MLDILFVLTGMESMQIKVQGFYPQKGPSGKLVSSIQPRDLESYPHETVMDLKKPQPSGDCG
jgi:hypothetical protein